MFPVHFLSNFKTHLAIDADTQMWLRFMIIESRLGKVQSQFKVFTILAMN